MVADVFGLLVAILILNLICYIAGSSMRFGWYNKKDEERGRINHG